YDRAMEGQRERARAGSSFEAKRTQEFAYTSDSDRASALAPGDQFEGYASTCVKGVPVVAVFDAERRQAKELRQGATGFVVLERTPFYLESGGQVSDSGTLETASGSSATVTGMVRLAAGGPRAHRVSVDRGTLKARDLVA